MTANIAHVASSPKLLRIWSPISGASANPIAGALPNAPMYAPRMSAGASSATTAWDVGTQSISPTTNTTMTKRIAARQCVQTRSRNGSPITSSATTSFGAAGSGRRERA